MGEDTVLEITCKSFYSTSEFCHQTTTVVVANFTGEEAPEDVLPYGWGVYETGAGVFKIACPYCLRKINAVRLISNGA